MTTYVDRINHGGSSIHVEEVTNNGTITFTTKNSGTPSEKFRITSTGVLVSADLAMGGNRITGLGAPTASTDVATKGYIDTEISTVGTSISAALQRTGGTMLGAIAMGSNKITGLGTPSATGDAATKGYVDTEVANLVDSSPAALNTLNELAAAINDDANFSTTVTNSIADKLNASAVSAYGLTLIDDADAATARTTLGLGTAATSASSAFATSAQGTTADSAVQPGDLATVATTGSYNDLSNKPTIPTNNNQLTNGAGYITATLTNEQVQDIVGGMLTSNTESGITVTYQDTDGTIDFSVSSQTDNNFTTTLKNKLDGIESGATADQTASEILTAIKTVDGSGSGLDADTLDGINSSSFLRSDANDTYTGTLSITGQINNASTAGASGAILGNLEVGYGAAYNSISARSNSALHLNYNSTGTVYVGSNNTVWHSGNDGSGSGLDADTVDGIQGASFLRSDANDTYTGVLTGGGASRLSFSNTNANYDTAAEIPSSGCHIINGADNGTSTSVPANINFYSWYGVGFGPSITGQTVTKGELSHVFNVRNGDANFRGTLTVGNAIITGTVNFDISQLTAI